MIIVKKLAAKLEIELAFKLFDPIADVLRLKLNVKIVVETDFRHDSRPLHRDAFLYYLTIIPLLESENKW